MGLYHKDIGFPTCQVPSAYDLHYSQHAQRQAQHKGIQPLPEGVLVGPEDLIELETRRNGPVNEPVKCVFRVPHTTTHDLIIVVKPDGFVKTVWLNAVDDLHDTLDASKYDRP